MASVSLWSERASAPGDWTWHTIGVCERFAAAMMLAVVSPLVIAAAVGVAVLSGRSPLIAHRRVGWRGEALWMLKLRTMWGGVRPTGGFRWIERIDDEAGPARKTATDPRVTNRFARLCRRHSIDEIPQLWHVVRGEMSLVGPRPVTAAEIRAHYGTAAEETLQVKPGIAGLWQVSGRNTLSYDARRALDLEFVRTRSAAMYVRILLRTIPVVFSGSNSW